MPFTQPATGEAWALPPPVAAAIPVPAADTATLSAQEHEQLSIAARYAVLTGDETGARAAVPHGRLELWEKQFLGPAKGKEDRESEAQIKRHETEAYERAKGKDAARRRLLEEAAVERGHLSGRILSYRQLQELTPPRDLVPNVMWTGGVGVIGGDSQVGKSWVMLSVAAAAATGTAWPIGSKPDARRCDPMPVLYVAAEDGGAINRRLRNWEEATGKSLDDESGHIFHTHPGAVSLLDEVAIGEVCDVVEERGYRLVVFDTVAASLGGEEEGNPQFSKVVQHMRKIVAAMNGQGCAFLVHHTGKDASKGLRGGSALFDDADIVWILDGDIDAITMKNKKWKIDEERRPWRLRLSRNEGEPVYLRRDDSSASMSVAAEDSKWIKLENGITQACMELAGHNRGFGPSGYGIREWLKDHNVSTSTSDATSRIKAMVERRALHTSRGARGATYYRLPEEQEQIPT